MRIICIVGIVKMIVVEIILLCFFFLDVKVVVLFIVILFVNFCMILKR